MLDVILSDGLPTGTGFCSVTNPDLHLVMLMAGLGFIAAQTSVLRIAGFWKGFDLLGAVWWFRVG